MATQTSLSWLQRNGKLLLLALLALVVALYRIIQAGGSPSVQFPTPAASQIALKGSPSEPAGLAFFKTFHEQDAGFDLIVNYPYLQDASDPSAEAFDRAIEAFVQRVVDAFKANTHPDAKYPVNMTADYRVLYDRDGLISVYYEVTTISAGAPHPGNTSMTFNFSRTLNRPLRLGDLFQSGAGYLEVLSAYCTGTLKVDGRLAFEKGAEPTLENYRNWNITPDGLLITFDPYQVAPYSAGFVQVTVPYSILETIIDPQGPVAGLAGH